MNTRDKLLEISEAVEMLLTIRDNAAERIADVSTVIINDLHQDSYEFVINTAISLLAEYSGLIIVHDKTFGRSDHNAAE